MAEISILEVSGEGCANCLSLLPVLTRLAAEKHVPLSHLEVSEETADRVKELSIERVPTVLVLRDGVPVARCSGFQPEEILDVWLDAKIEEASACRRAESTADK